MQRFIILTKERSGSTYLNSWLNKHPNVLSLGELINDRSRPVSLLSWVQNNKNRRAYFLVKFILKHKYIGCFLSLLLTKLINEYIEFIFQSDLTLKDPIKSKKSRSANHTRGFKLIYTHLLLFWKMKKTLFRGRIIHLVRKDVLSIYLSIYFAKTTGVYHVKEKTVQPKLRLPLRFIKIKLHKIWLQQMLFTKLIKRFDNIEVLYDDLFYEKPEETKKKILEFLNVEEVHMAVPDLVKLAPKKIKDRISNYPELVEKLKNTRFAQFL